MVFAQIHPMLVPFAVALLVTGVVFEYYGKFQNEESARTAGGLNIRLGLAFAVVARTFSIRTLEAALEPWNVKSHPPFRPIAS